MTSNDAISQYAAAAHSPFIKNPSLRVPALAILPVDIHPLPDSLSDYMVYPFTLEPHVLAFESSRKTTFAAHAARREAYIKQREDDKERRRREALRRVAPGFDPNSPLIPTRATPVHSPTSSISIPPASGNTRTANVMDNLVEQLAALDATHDHESKPLL